MGIKCYTEFDIPNCDYYKSTLLDLNKNSDNFALIVGEEHHYMKFLSNARQSFHYYSGCCNS
jgi:hypothetical protein